jgi:hypothetical protein
MALIEQSIGEIRQLMTLYMTGQIDEKQFSTMMSGYAQTEKLIGHRMKGIFAESQLKGASKTLVTSGLIGQGEAIPVKVIPDIEMVVCPDQEKTITRAECLDYSGDHMTECATCKHKRITHRRLLPER